MKKIILVIIALAIFIPSALKAQDETETRKTFGIGIVPQYAITKGARFDFDFRLKKKGQWIVVAPQIYIDPGNSNSWNYEEMVGAGIDIQHKFFFKDRPIPRGAYLAYGPVFQYFSIKDQGLSSYGFEENGVDYIALQDDMLQTSIYKFGGNLIFGLQTVISDFFYLDAYMGTGVRLSFDNRVSGLHGYYNDWWGDFGYSGTLIVAGIRFGISL